MREHLLPWIDQAADHWYWTGPVQVDSYARRPVYNTAATSYSVSRLLWFYANPTAPWHQFMLRNTCGTLCCINPAHWQRCDIYQAYGLPPAAGVALYASKFAPRRHLIHLVSDGAPRAICGTNIFPEPVEATRELTCKACVQAWLAQGRPLPLHQPP